MIQNSTQFRTRGVPHQIIANQKQSFQESKLVNHDGLLSFITKLGLLCMFMLFGVNGVMGQTYYNMSSGDYSQTFTNLSTSYPTNMNGLAVLATGTIPVATKTSTATNTSLAAVVTSTALGYDAVASNSTKMIFLCTGSTDNSAAVGCDLNLDFTGRTAGNLTFNYACILNSSVASPNGRSSSLIVYYSTDGITWNTLGGPYTVYNNTGASTANVPISITLPAALNNQANVKFRFYEYNGGTIVGTPTGSRAKISLDDITVSSTSSATSTDYFWNGNGGSPLSANFNTGPWSLSASTSAALAWPGTGTNNANFSNTQGGTVTMPTSYNTTPNNVILGSGNYTFSTAASTPSTLSSSINLNANNLTVSPNATSAALNLSGIISGTSGSLTTTTGTTVLSGANTFTGSTTINSGTLSVAADNNLGAGSLSLNGGTLAVTTGFTSSKAVNVASSSTTNITAGQTLTLSGILSGSSGLLVNGGGSVLTTGGVLALTGTSNTYSGNFTIGNSDGSGAAQLNLSAISNLSNNAITVNSNSQLNIPSLSGVTFNPSGALTLNGIGTLANSGAIRVVTPTSVAWSGPVTIGSSGAILSVTSSVSNNFTLSGATTFSGTLTKAGGGVLTLSSASNSGSGATTIGNGTVTVSSGSSLGTGNLSMAQTSTNATNLNLNNTAQSIGNLSSSWAAATGTIAQTITLGSGHTLTINQAGNTTFGAGAVSTLSSILAGSGAISKSGSGTLTLTSGNTFSGGTTVTVGTLSLGASNVLADAGTVNINGGILNSSGAFTETLGALTLTSGSITGATGALTPSSMAVQAGTIDVILAGSGGMTKSTSGTVFVTNAGNTYSGGTTINAGILSVDGPNRLGSSSGTLTINNGTLQVTGGISSARNIVLGDAASTIEVVGSGVSYSTTTGVISGTGTLNKTGSGILACSTPCTYSGSTKINGGTIRLNAADVLPATQLFLDGGTFSTGATTGFNETVGTLNIASNNGTISLGTGAHTLTFAASNGVTWNGTSLTVNGWTGTAGGSGTAGKIFVGTDSTGLTAGQLAKITFSGYGGVTAIILSTGEIVPAVSLLPTISTAGTLSAVNTTYGTASATPSTFTASGTNLTADISISAPSGFEISQTAGGTTGYASTQTLTQSGGTVSSTTIYVRLTSTAIPNSYSGNIALTSTNATPVNVATVSSTVTPKALTITGLTADSRTYNATLGATFTGTPVLNGVVNADVVSITGSGTASFLTKTVGTNKQVNFTGYSLTGANSGNYSLTQPSSTADITKASLTITGAAVTSKQFDGNTNATITGGTLSGVISPDVVTYVGTGTFASSAVGTWAVTANCTTGGADGSNYEINPQPSPLTGTITPGPTTLAAGDIAVIGYNTNGSPDNFAILVLKELNAGTVFYVNDNEVASPGGTTFTDLAEVEASFTVNAGQTIPAGTVIVLPWGTTAVTTTEYTWSATSSAGLGSNNEEIYVYTAASITAQTPTTFIYYAKIGSSSSSVPSGLTSGSTSIAPSGGALRYTTSGALYTGCQTALLNAIGNTASNWNITGATTIAISDWTFTVNPACATISSTGTLSALSTTYGTASSETSFNVSGVGMTAGITVTPPAGFEVSLTSGSGFASSVVVGTAGTISSTMVYVRLAASTVLGTYSGNIALTSATATAVNVATLASTVTCSLPTVTISGTATICNGASAILTAAGADTYIWSSPLTATTNTVSVSPTSTTIYTVTGSVTGGCTATSTIEVVVKQPSAASTVTINAACGATSVNLPAGGNVATTSAISQAVTYTNSVGCDSIVTYNITYKTASAPTAVALTPACGVTSVTLPNGASTSNTNAVVTYANVAGCDSVVTYNITYKVPSASMNAMSNCTAITWNGQSVAATGTYTASFTNAAGCDSIATLNFTKLNATSSIINITQFFSYVIPGTTTTITTSGTTNQVYTAANTCDSTVTYNVTIKGLVLCAKAFLSGPYNVTTGLMTDSLRQKGLLPLSTPYGSGTYTLGYTSVNNISTETTTPAVLAVTGINAIVDWVFVQIRSKADSSIVLGTRSALMQRDGDIVDMDGTSPLKFADFLPDNFFVSIKHRNHIGIMTANKYALSLTPNCIDFTTTSTPLFIQPGKKGNPAPLTGPTRIQNGVRTLYAGNCNILTALTSRFITYNVLTTSDRNELYVATGGTNTLNTYTVYDVDMNGFARFNGLDPDRNVILSNCAGSNSLITNEQTPN